MRKGNGDGEKLEVEVTDDRGLEAVAEAPDSDMPEDRKADAALSGEGMDALAEARRDAEGYKDRWLRLAAEFDNYKKRTAREFGALVQSAGEDILREILPILDAVDRALVQEGKALADSEEFRQGIRMIMEQLPRALRNRGLSEIEAEGKPFDPHYHEALMQIPSEAHGAGVVANVMEKGYLLGDKVLRHAKVVVSSGPPASQEVKPDTA